MATWETSRARTTQGKPLPAVRLACLGLLCLGGMAHGQVATDGSLGPRGTLKGPNYQVSSALGRTAGANLFHSFSQLSIQRGQSVTFTAPEQINNILARVTGGSASRIDGTIRTRIETAPSLVHPANFFLINPAGVVFGPDAQLDVGGAFAVTTADVVKLKDGGRFAASTVASQSVLTSAPPAAFGFLAASPQSVQVQGATLQVPQRKTLAIVGGSLRLTSAATLRAPQGQVKLVSAAGPGDAKLDASSSSNVDVRSLSRLGDIAASSGTSIDVSGAAAGAVIARAGTLTLDQSVINAQTIDENGGAIDLALTGQLALSHGAKISSSTLGTGRAGDILIHTGSLNIVDGSQIVAISTGAGDGGNIDVTASGSIRLDGQGSRQGTGLSAETDAVVNGGRGGRILVHAGSLNILDLGLIFASTKGSGPGGAITVHAGSVRIDGTKPQDGTGIGAQTLLLTGGGPGGDITVETPRLTLVNGSIGASTFGSGTGGDITVRADQINMDGDNFPFTGFVAETGFRQPLATGRGGSIQILGQPFLTLNNGAFISTSSFAAGDGGSIRAQAAQLTMDGHSQIRSSSTGTGNAGRVSIQSVGPVVLNGKSSIQGTATQSNGGNVSVAGQSITLTNSTITTRAKQAGGNVTMVSGSDIDVVSSTISAEAGNEGNITMRAPGDGTVSFFDSIITARAVTLGGQIAILGPQFVILNRSVINGIGGGRDVLVRVTAGDFLKSTDSLILTDRQAFTVDTNLASNLAALSASLISVGTQLQDLCGLKVGDISSFIVVGRGGTPVEPGGWLPSLDLSGPPADRKDIPKKDTR